MNPCVTGKRQIAIAVVKSSSGLEQKIHLLTVADLVHLFALAMGYRPDIAFAFGVISRSVPEIQAGECDVSLDMAQKAIRIASLISSCRETNSIPEDIRQAESILAATSHVHTVEAAYTELCKEPGMLETFAKQYNDWFAGTTEVTKPKKSVFKKLRELFTGSDMKSCTPL
jgi:hypothetical protein